VTVRRRKGAKKPGPRLRRRDERRQMQLKRRRSAKRALPLVVWRKQAKRKARN